MSGLGSSLYCYILRKNSVLWITVPSSNQVHKWVLANLILGVTLRNSTPYSGGGEKKHCFMLWKTECHPEEPFGLNVNWDCACPDLSALLTFIVKTKNISGIKYLFVICALLVLDLWCTDWVSGDLSCIHWMELKHTLTQLAWCKIQVNP